MPRTIPDMLLIQLCVETKTLPVDADGEPYFVLHTGKSKRGQHTFEPAVVDWARSIGIMVVEQGADLFHASLGPDLTINLVPTLEEAHVQGSHALRYRNLILHITRPWRSKLIPLAQLLFQNYRVGDGLELEFGGGRREPYHMPLYSAFNGDDGYWDSIAVGLQVRKPTSLWFGPHQFSIDPNPTRLFRDGAVVAPSKYDFFLHW